MKIDQEKCVACENCLPYCPAEAIKAGEDRVKVDEELCFECGVCSRVEACPTDAFYEPDYVFEHPRSVRKAFSDPSVDHSETNMPGRGTEEVKTNDVTNRVEKGYVGIGLEMGRPSVGTTVKEVEKATKALAENGFSNFEECNPVFALMKNPETGEMKEDVLEERLLSAIIELDIPEDELEKCFKVVKEIADKIDTVFTMDLISCYDEDMKLRVEEMLDESSFEARPNAKINIGVGKAE